MATALFLLSGQNARATTEAAPYQQVRAASPFELRDYPALTVVEAPLDDEGNSGFGRLFRFISGRNASGEKIAMTTPVLMGGSEGRATMAFVMPAALKLERVPRPNDATLSVRGISAGRFAVLRFSGGRSVKNQTTALERLRGWLAAEKLTASSPPVYAYFDPPWVPTFLRHNEVMLRLDSSPP
jgi:DNA gyrase inhibitor GyrI